MIRNLSFAAFSALLFVLGLRSVAAATPFQMGTIVACNS